MFELPDDMSGSVYSDKYLEGQYVLLERKLKLKTQ